MIGLGSKQKKQIVSARALVVVEVLTPSRMARVLSSVIKNDSWKMTNSSTGRHRGDDPLLSNLIEQGRCLHSRFESVYW